MAEPGSESSPRGPSLVPASVTNRKFERQLKAWHTNSDALARRGCLLLSEGDLTVDVGIMQHVPIAGRTIPVMTVCVRVDYWNFDLWAPSVTFIDPITRAPAPPPVRAIDRASITEEPRDALIDQHPQTGLPFICLPGVREYHNHPQHTGDSWLLHRHRHEGDLIVICERLWRRMARNVVGASVATRSLAVGPPGNINTQLEFAFLQGDRDMAPPEPSAATPGPG